MCRTEPQSWTESIRNRVGSREGFGENGTGGIDKRSLRSWEGAARRSALWGGDVNSSVGNSHKPANKPVL